MKKIKKQSKIFRKIFIIKKFREKIKQNAKCPLNLEENLNTGK